MVMLRCLHEPTKILGGNMDLQHAVIALHDIAREIETQVGQGQLSEDVRRCADRLHVIINPIESNHDRIRDQ